MSTLFILVLTAACLFVFSFSILYAEDSPVISSTASTAETVLVSECHKTCDSGDFFVSYIFNDLKAKSRRSLNFDFSIPFFDITAVKPFDRQLGSSDDPVVMINFISKNFGIGYLKNGDSRNYDSFLLNIFFLRLGWNYSGKTGGTSYYGKWNNARNQPEHFFVSFDFNFDFCNSPFSDKLKFALGYSDGFSAGLTCKTSSRFSFDWRYNFRSSYLDELRKNSEGFRNTLSLEWNF